MFLLLLVPRLLQLTLLLLRLLLLTQLLVPLLNSSLLALALKILPVFLHLFHLLHGLLGAHL